MANKTLYLTLVPFLLDVTAIRINGTLMHTETSTKLRPRKLVYMMKRHFRLGAELYEKPAQESS